MIERQHVITSLEANVPHILELVGATPAGQLKRRPANGGWSIHEHACHLAVVQPLMMKRLDFMLATDRPIIKGYQPSRDEDPEALLRMDLGQALATFQRERAAMVERIRGLSADQWAIRASHEEYHDYGVAIMFRHLALHDCLHAYRMEQVLLEIGY